MSEIQTTETRKINLPNFVKANILDVKDKVAIMVHQRDTSIEQVLTWFTEQTDSDKLLPTEFINELASLDSRFEQYKR